MEGQVALVTGGGSGIGRGVIEAFIAEGARVAALEIDPRKVDDLRSAYGDRIRVVCGDVVSFADNQAAVGAAVESFGKLDTLVCVAGIWDYKIDLLDFPAERLSAAFDEIFAVNVKAALFAVKAAADELIRHRGSVILTASNAAFYPDGGGSLYTSSKFAVRGLVTQLAHELAPKVRVNGVAPGGTVTKLRGLKSMEHEGMTLDSIPNLASSIAQHSPLQMAGEPSDHASAYVYLAAQGRGATVTGTIIRSDGGMGVRGIDRIAGLVD